MVHVYRVTAAQPVADETPQDSHGPMPASSDPKLQFIQGLRSAFQNYRQQKQLEG